MAAAVLLSSCGGGNSGGVGLPYTGSVNLATSGTLNAKGSTSGVELNWSAAQAAPAYAVYRCPVPAGVVNNLCGSIPPEGCGAPISVTSANSFVDVPPAKAPQAYCYQVRACADGTASTCGPVFGTVASAQRIPAPERQMTTVIGDDGREVISGLTTSLHAFADGAKGNVTWHWTQESGPKVSLAGTNTPDLTFTAPNVTVNTLISFVLRSSDDNGSGAPSKVAVTVLPADNLIVKTDTAARPVQAGHVVNLSARGSAQGLTYAWRQVSPATPQVTLTGANTDNPSFTAPVLTGDTVLTFEVTAADPVTGQSSSARTAVQVLAGVPVAPGALPAPLQLAQMPNQVPQAIVAMPLPLTPQKTPPQPLLLLASPEAVATGGTSVQLGMASSGGTLPYTWSWTQIGGPAATIADADQPVVTVQVPVVASAQTLTFRATLKDAAGAVRTAQAVVQATLAPQPSGGSVPTPLTSLPVKSATPGTPVQTAVPLTGVTLVQNAGPQLQFAQQPDGSGGTLVTVTAPLIKDSSASASVTVTGKDANGQTQAYLLPVLILLAPGQAPAANDPANAPIPQQVLVPKQDDPLVLVGPNGASADEGRQAATIGFLARGGKGTASYSYRIDYVPGAGGPNIGFTGVAAHFTQINIPLVDHPTDLTFQFQVTDGVQVATKTYTVHVNDLAPSANVGTLTPLTAQSGHHVTLSMPALSGGFPFTDGYHYSVSQTGGPPLGIPPLPINGAPGNFGFNVPTLAVGAADVVLTFELAATDSSGSVVKVTQQVTVTAPPAPVPAVAPPVAAVVAPTIMTFSAGTGFPPLILQARVTGGRAPYTYQWTVQRNYTPAPGSPPGDLTGTGQNPSIAVPPVDFSQVSKAELQVLLRVTDADGRTADATADSPVLLQSGVVYPGGDMLICGDIQNVQNVQGAACSDLDLVLAMTARCPDTAPFGMNDIFVVPDGANSAQVLEVRRCVDANIAYNLWYLQTRPKGDACLNFDPSFVPPQQTECHLACAGDGCNIDTIPRSDKLLKPGGPGGTLTNDAGTALQPR